MKLRSALLCLCMLAVAAPAFAQGQLFLNFTDCNDTNVNKQLNCASTLATTLMVASAMPATIVPGVIADLGYIDCVVGTDPAVMPAFWQFQQGGCAGAARIIFDVNFLSNVNCIDVWAGIGSTGGQWGGVFGPTPDGNRARLKWTTNIDPALAFDVPADKCYLQKVTLRQAPAATCPGCNNPVCLVFLSESLSLLSGGAMSIDFGGHGTEFLTINDPTNSRQCPGPTPTRNSTWGQVKSLYK